MLKDGQSGRANQERLDGDNLDTRGRGQSTLRQIDRGGRSSHGDAAVGTLKLLYQSKPVRFRDGGLNPF